MASQEILARAVRGGVIMNVSNVVGFVDHGTMVIKERFYVEDSPHITKIGVFLSFNLYFLRKCIRRQILPPILYIREVLHFKFIIK
jgi:hypothetical protein